MTEKKLKKSKTDTEPQYMKDSAKGTEITPQTNLNPNCPCKRDCIRHGNCNECRAVHEAEGKYPTCCQRRDKRKEAHSMDFGQAAELVEALRSKDETKAYQCFKLLEKESSDTDHVYPFFDLFADMIEDENSYVRTRGLLLIAANARWDTENKIDELIDSYLKHIEDVKPITSRQCIKALPSIVKYKPDLYDCICTALEQANPGIYRDSMSSLVMRDIAEALASIRREGR